MASWRKVYDVTSRALLPAALPRGAILTILQRVPRAFAGMISSFSLSFANTSLSASTFLSGPRRKRSVAASEAWPKAV